MANSIGGRKVLIFIITVIAILALAVIFSPFYNVSFKGEDIVSIVWALVTAAISFSGANAVEHLSDKFKK